MQELRARMEAAGQGHVFQHWNRLSTEEQERLVVALEGVDLDLVQAHRALLLAPESASHPVLEPPKLFPSAPQGADAERAQLAIARGQAWLSQGKVGYVLVAGGQGSRLGFEGPKGKFPVGPLTGRTLFGWHAARIRAAEIRYERRAPWFVMTSASNDAETRGYFESERYFGLDPDSVHFFQQAMIPALDREGRMVMSGPGELFLAPNGHGGTLDALHSSGLLDRAIEMGIETFSYFQVDNPLARPADPLFLGLHLLEGAHMSSKVVAKSGPMEKVGVLGMADGVLGCIEYSDLPPKLRDATDDQGRLMFRAGNIAVHALQAQFVRELTTDGLHLPWHLARKQMPAVDEKGQTQTIEGIKFETFIFDALARCPHSVTLEVERALEFSPVKNAEGADSPDSCRTHLTELFEGWTRAAHLAAPPRDGSGRALIEVDPCFAETTADFLARMPRQAHPLAGGWLFA
ncbi:MAG: UTP--glucose-1-phosphate uridylyltransferase [Planctomycetes bacterium]|nr:UTP--glucose-1-phosphate uridylyltransferase [Planctomycetota bacterium]MCB9910447.1 UTP--glucose-1-phosphate uridylyltransferase [Planctomycetota bacterium]MCB9912573.1 UTP--glucose-1-phosphate uridylyltransferase [Planctomycetota bacterium]HPF14714.1 UTP--glucose-1-phosphate uridylyltransferase [Planctomycetota bacterium]